MFDTIYSQVGAAVLLLVCGFALFKGDKLEQTGAAVFFVAWVAAIFAQDDTATLTPKLIWLAIDSAMLVIFAALAWKFSRSWPLFATAFQTIAVLAHVAYLMNLHIGEFAYLSAVAISGYGGLATLAVGTWVAWRERRALTF